MSNEKQVLVVDRAEGPLAGVMSELDQLGFRVIWIPTLETALQFIEASHNLSLVVVSEDAAASSSPELRSRMKAAARGVRIVWGVQADGARPSRAPNAANRKLFHVDELRRVASRLLTDHFYPPEIARAIKTAAVEVLGTVGDFRIVGDAFLTGDQTVLSDVNAVLPFHGGVSGHLMVSMTSEHARAVYHEHLPKAPSPRIDQLEDMVGELCNQVLGRINAFLAARALQVKHATPIFIRSAGSTMRYRGRQPSFGVELLMGQNRIFLEYYLEEIDRDQLSRGEGADVVALGEIRYL